VTCPRPLAETHARGSSIYLIARPYEATFSSFAGEIVEYRRQLSERSELVIRIGESLEGITGRRASQNETAARVDEIQLPSHGQPSAAELLVERVGALKGAAPPAVSGPQLTPARLVVHAF
jgi:hypothetical protein